MFDWIAQGSFTRKQNQIAVLVLENCYETQVNNPDIMYSPGQLIAFRGSNMRDVTVTGGTVMWANFAVTRMQTFNQPAAGVNRRLLIQKCRLGGSFGDDGLQTYGNESDGGTAYNIVVRDCVLYMFGENAIDAKWCKRLLVERCVVHGSVGADNGFQTPDRGEWQLHGSGGALLSGAPSFHSIFRYNLLYDNLLAIRLSDGNYAYNNTIINNHRDVSGPQSPYQSYGSSGSFNFAGI
jgi:hypothetical protein